MAKTVKWEPCPTGDTFKPVNSTSDQTQIQQTNMTTMQLVLQDHTQLLKEQSFLLAALVSRLQKHEIEFETLQQRYNEQSKDCQDQQRREKPTNQDANVQAAKLIEPKSRKRNAQNTAPDTAERRKQLRRETIEAILESLQETDEE
jgi:hypothetical protein